MPKRKLTYIELYGSLQGVVNTIEAQTPKTILPGQVVEPRDPVVYELELILTECREGVVEADLHQRVETDDTVFGYKRRYWISVDQIGSSIGWTSKRDHGQFYVVVTIAHPYTHLRKELAELVCRKLNS